MVFSTDFVILGVSFMLFCGDSMLLGFDFVFFDLFLPALLPS